MVTSLDGPVDGIYWEDNMGHPVGCLEFTVDIPGKVYGTHGSFLEPYNLYIGN